MPNTTVINGEFSGATTDSTHVHADFNGFTVSGLLQEVAHYHVKGTADSLFIIHIGYNNLNSIINPDQYVVETPFTKEIVANNVIKGIMDNEKKYHGKHFLVMTCPPSDKWPVVKDADKAKANELIVPYNILLKVQLLQIKDLDIKVLDSHAWFENAIAYTEKLGLRTDNDPCVPGIGNTEACSDPTKHFFFDSYRPEAKVHKTLGDCATGKIESMWPGHE